MLFCWITLSLKKTSGSGSGLGCAISRAQVAAHWAVMQRTLTIQKTTRACTGPPVVEEASSQNGRNALARPSPSPNYHNRNAAPVMQKVKK